MSRFEIRPKPDRRRSSNDGSAACARCGHPSTQVIVRFQHTTFVRCDNCHHVQRVLTAGRVTLA